MMPLPFEFEIHWPRDATEWTAWTGLALVVVTAIYVLLTRATVEQLRTGTAKTVRELRESTEKTVRELREARFAEFLPMLRWQSPKAAVGIYNGGNMTWELELDILLSNEGPGPARLYDYSVTTDTREVFDVVEVDRPSTMPKGGTFGDRITFKIRSGRRGVFQAGRRVFTAKVVYGDLLGEFEYETAAVVEAYFADTGPHTAQFLESDERSALDRRRSAITRRTS